MNMRGSNLLTVILAGVCGVLLLLTVALQLGFERGYSWLPLDSQQAAAGIGSGKVNQAPFNLPPEKDFAETTQRPLFNEDRQPTPPGDDDTPEPPAPPKVALNIDLTGIILTPNLHLAMIHDKSDNSTVALKEGMPMPGKQGGWTLTEIKPRSAVFREAQGDEVEVELTTAVAGPTRNPQRPEINSQQRRQPAGRFVPGQPMPKPTNARERRELQLQQRIEQRRKQMREQAARLRELQRQRHQHN